MTREQAEEALDQHFQAKANCDRCFGRGVVGQDTVTGNWRACSCVRKRRILKPHSTGNATTQKKIITPEMGAFGATLDALHSRPKSS